MVEQIVIRALLLRSQAPFARGDVSSDVAHSQKGCVRPGESFYKSYLDTKLDVKWEI